MKDREEYISILEVENAGLKKELETSNELVAEGTLIEMKLRDENRRLRKEYQDTYKDVRIEIKEYKNQQKEFIKYLEDEIEKTCNSKGMSKCSLYQEILSKYKEIIEDIENDSKK